MENCLSKDVAIAQDDEDGQKRRGLGVLKSVIGAVGRIFKEPPASKNKIEDPQTINRTYAFWRISIFISIYVIYFVSYLSRKNLSAAMSPMSHDIGISKTALGVLSAVFYATYGIGKFVNGMLADRASVRAFLPFSLTAAGIASAGIAFSVYLANNHFFGITSATGLITLMAICWGLNGWFQSAAFPLCGKSLTFWFSNKERGVKWSWWSTSHEFGSSGAMLLAAYIIMNMGGWKSAFYIPAIVSVIVSIGGFVALRDKPKTIGLPNIEKYHNTIKNERKREDEEDEDGATYGQVFVKYILRNKNMWLLGAAFVFVYILRLGPLDWMITYFMEVNHDSVIMAAIKACAIPLFGSIGTLTIPYVSDKIFGGRRAPANFFYLMLAVVALAAFRFTAQITTFVEPAINAIGLTADHFRTVWIFLLLALLGIATCGPLVLIGGLCSVESASKKVAAAATGFTGAAGYVGAIIASVTTGRLIDKFGYNTAIEFWLLSALAGALICIPLWNARSRLSD